MIARVLLVGLIASSVLVAEGCRPRLRYGAYGGGSGSRASKPKPEDMKIETSPLDANATKRLNENREKWKTYVTKYGADGQSGAAQVIAVFDGMQNDQAWWEKPKPEDLLHPLGTAIGDALAKEGHVSWCIAEGYVCLVSSNGKVAVGPVSIADSWLTNKKQTMETLRGEVAKAVRETTGEPVFFGGDDPEGPAQPL